MQNQAVNMTQGPIAKAMIAFALPIFFGNLFQQLYNAADAFIVGNFLGGTALAAVSATSSLIFLLVGFFQGIAMGAGVVTAQYFGAQHGEDLQKSIHTLIAFGLIISVVLTLIGVFLTPYILVWMHTPAEVLAEAVTYLRIYFSGVLGLVMYNVFVGVLQSVGDSRHPLEYLVISSLTNIVLDLFFIGVLGFGVGSAAVATIIAQFFSAALCLRRLIKTDAPYRVFLHKIRIHKEMLKKILRYGLPSGVQNSIVSLANVVVQSHINGFGAFAMAGSGAYQKIESMALSPVNSVMMAISTFVGQNVGAGRLDRAKKGAGVGLFCAAVVAQGAGVLVFFLAPYLVAAFNNEPEVVAFGVSQARIISLFYFLPAVSHSFAAIFRGAGRPMVPMVLLLTCWCLIRVLFLTVAVPFFGMIQVVYWAYPLTWSISTLIFLLYWKKAALFR